MPSDRHPKIGMSPYLKPKIPLRKQRAYASLQNRILTSTDQSGPDSGHTLRCYSAALGAQGSCRGRARSQAAPHRKQPTLDDNAGWRTVHDDNRKCDCDVGWLVGEVRAVMLNSIQYLFQQLSVERVSQLVASLPCLSNDVILNRVEHNVGVSRQISDVSRDRIDFVGQRLQIAIRAHKIRQQINHVGWRC